MPNEFFKMIKSCRNLHIIVRENIFQETQWQLFGSVKKKEKTLPPMVLALPSGNLQVFCRLDVLNSHHHHHHQSLNREGRWGTTDAFATSFLHSPLFSAALWDLPNSRPVHSLMLSSHLFLCPPCLLPPFTVPCKMVLARPDERENMTIPLQFASLYDRQEIFVWSNCLLDFGTNFLVGNMVFV